MTIKELLEKKGKQADDIRSLAELANDDSHDWSADDEAKWERANSAFDETQAALEAAEKDEEQRKVKAERAAHVEGLLKDTRNIGREDMRGESAEVSLDEKRSMALGAWMKVANDVTPSDRELEACREVGFNPNCRGFDIRLNTTYNRSEPAWYRGGSPMLEKRLPERRDLNVATGADGEYTIPEGFMADLERTLLAFNGPRQVSRIIPTSSGNPIPWPTVDDTGNPGTAAAEASAVGASVDPTFGENILNAYKTKSGAVLISQELLEDSAFNMGSLIPELLGERIGRRENAVMTTGTGSSEQQGVVTGSSLGVTAAAVAALTADELIDLEHSVDPAYRSGGSVGYMFHDSTLLAIRKLKDGNGQYLWQPGLQVGAPDVINSRPYTVNQNMATLATGQRTVLFGDYSKFIIRDVGTIRVYRLDERYRENDQTGFMAFKRSDSRVINSGAIKHLIQA